MSPHEATSVATSAADSPPDVSERPAAGHGPPGAPGGRRRPGFATRVGNLWEATWRPVVVLVLVIAVWWFASWRDFLADYLLPSPKTVWDEIIGEWSLLAEHSWVTFYETVVGFTLAVLIGLAAAILIVYSPTLEKALYPLILFLQVPPKIAFAPLLIAWFGLGVQPKIILAVLIAFFPMVISGVAGLRSTDPELLDLSATMGASRWKTFRKIRFPGALPHLMAGAKVAVTLAVVGAVVGEFVAADEGLGYILLIANGNLDGALLFADIILMSTIGVALFVVIEVIEALLIPWHASRRENGSVTLSTS